MYSVWRHSPAKHAAMSIHLSSWPAWRRWLWRPTSRANTSCCISTLLTLCNMSWGSKEKSTSITLCGVEGGGGGGGGGVKQKTHWRLSLSFGSRHCPNEKKKSQQLLSFVFLEAQGAQTPWSQKRRDEETNERWTVGLKLTFSVGTENPSSSKSWTEPLRFLCCSFTKNPAVNKNSFQALATAPPHDPTDRLQCQESKRKRRISSVGTRRGWQRFTRPGSAGAWVLSDK